LSKIRFIKKQHERAKIELQQFLDTPGTHGIVYGVTGSGKTTQLLWILDKILKRKEIILWRDVFKNNEMGVLGAFNSLRVFVPESCNLKIKNPLSSYEVVEISDYNTLFKELKKDKINVVSVDFYFRKRVQKLEFWSLFFEELVNRAVMKKLHVPMALFFDEFNQLAPSRHQVSEKGQASLTSWISQNLEALRATKTRILAAAHGQTKLEKSIRDSFLIHFYKRTMGRVYDDLYVLRKVAKRIENLRIDQCIVLTAGKYYSNPMHVPDYKIGELCDKINVIYEGQIGDWKCASSLTPDEPPEDNRKPLLLNAVGYMAIELDFNQSRIARILGCSQQHVSRLLKEFREKLDNGETDIDWSKFK
jgi:hypothetical protein